MKIITDFKDFYDYSMVFGVDPGVTYNRFISKIDPPKIDNKFGSILGFCDMFWEVKKVSIEDENVSYWRRRYNYKPITYKDKSEKMVEDGYFEGSPISSRYNRDEIEYYYWLKPIENISNMQWDPNNWRNLNYTHWNNWVKNIFSEYSVPSFFIDGNDNFETTLNPILLDYGLQKTLSPTQAFQMVSSFIPALNQPDTTVEMTEEQKGRSKGFDEYSFRHKNTKKKPKKF